MGVVFIGSDLDFEIWNVELKKSALSAKVPYPGWDGSARMFDSNVFESFALAKVPVFIENCTR